MRSALLLLLASCNASASGSTADVTLPDFPARPRDRASAAFGRVWHDGRAEMSSYDAVVSRYDAPRTAELVLVTVTEPMDRRTWIKDDDVRGENRVEVLKENVSLKFETGIYPYSVLTSVFMPVDAWRGERFSPVKISLSVQEWCGHVFHGVWPGEDRFLERRFSYFASEGERAESVSTGPDVVYEDALLVQLRELDGPFAGGRDWHGTLVPSLWGARRSHVEARPVPASITRSSAPGVNRFELAAGSHRASFEVETAPPHRVVSWTTSEGDRARIRKTARLAYWELNHPGDERMREAIGLSP
jgi:hypothetical protein